MASLKVLIVNHKQRKDGKYPLAIRVIKNRKPKYIWLEQYILKKDWDENQSRVKKSHPNSARLNNYIAKKLAEANDTLLQLETRDESVSLTVIKAHLKKEHGNKSFFSLAKIYLDTLDREGKFDRLSSERPRVNRLKEFLKGEDCFFQDITVQVLQQFQAWLRATRNIKERTVVNHLIVIRTIYNIAIKAKIVDQKFYPFGHDGIVIRFPESSKIGLSKEEVETLEGLTLTSAAQRHALNVWLFSYYFAGIRVSDALRLKWTDLQNGRLYYQMGKNNKVGSLKISEKATTILAQYDRPDSGNQTLFPELNELDLADKGLVQKKIKNAVHKFNKHLRSVATQASITKPLTMHISRHTFGNLSGDKIPIQMLQKLYRHTDIKTTINYQSNFMFKDADEALESVIS